MQFFSKDALAFRDQFNNLRKVQSICLCGLFVAAYVALSFFNLKLTPYLEFRFAFLALAAAAAYGGPVMGMTAGIAGDVVSFFAAPPDRPLLSGLHTQLRNSRLCLRSDPVSFQGDSGPYFCSHLF